MPSVMAMVQDVHRMDSSNSVSKNNPYYPMEYPQRQGNKPVSGQLGHGATKAVYGDVSAQNSNFENGNKRTVQGDNATVAPDQASRPGVPPVSRSRCNSARAYDYGNQRPTVDQVPRATSTQPDKQPVHNPEYISHAELMKQKMDYSSKVSDRVDNGQNVYPNTQHGYPGQHGAPAHQHPNPYPGQHPSSRKDDPGYINRRQVESILQLQNRMRPKAPTPGMKNGPPSGNGLDNGFFKDSLNVDIPGDNISLSSNMSRSDSGYRSGDRGSASSTTSSGVDSPLPEGPKPHSQLTYGKTAFVCGYDSKNQHHSSNDSLDSAQSGQSCATLVGRPASQPLSNIPESLPPRKEQKQPVPLPKSAPVSQAGNNLLESSCNRIY